MRSWSAERAIDERLSGGPSHVGWAGASLSPYPSVRASAGEKIIRCFVPGLMPPAGKRIQETEASDFSCVGICFPACAPAGVINKSLRRFAQHVASRSVTWSATRWHRPNRPRPTACLSRSCGPLSVRKLVELLRPLSARERATILAQAVREGTMTRVAVDQVLIALALDTTR